MGFGSAVEVFFKALLDDGQLQVDAKKAGDKMGQTIGSTLSNSLGRAVKTTAFTALAGASAIAVRGITELSSITADFQAQTGASAEEAERAGKAINDMASRNLQPMREIGDALIKVHTDLGLTGEAAEKTTEAFLRYATATKQNAAAAVKDFDDILDAWGLTAEDAQGVMDKLIVAHQKYGGSIEQNQKDLANLAPQLKGLNLTIDDGIGLLDLFAASGLDASKAQFALNSAIQKLPPGTSLNDMIKKLAAIKDPAERARAAIEVFGARGGAALANVLRPGVNGLSDFAISADEAAGATNRAADAVESAFPNQVALRIKAIGSAIIGLGQTLGPLGSALTGIISLGGALGLDKALAGLWKAAGSSALVTGAVSAASDKAATLYLKALFAGDALAAVMASVWGRVIGLPVVGAAIQAAGVAAAGVFWTAAAAAALALPAIVFLAAIKLVNDNGLPGVSDSALGKQQKDFLDQQKARYEQGGADAGAAGAKALNDAWVSSSIEFANRQGKQAAAAVVDKYGDEMITRGKTVGSDFAAQMLSHFAEVNKLGPALVANAKRLANLAGLATAQGIRQQRDTVDQAWNDMLDGLKEATSVTGRTAHLLGLLASKELIKGLHSADPAVRAQARGTKQLILDELAALKPRAGTLSKEAMDKLRQGMKSKDPDIRAAANAIYKTIHTHLPDKSDGRTWGKNIGSGVAAGLLAGIPQVVHAANQMAGAIGGYLRISSPAKYGPLSTLGGPEGWGERIGTYFAKGLAAQLPDVGSMLSPLRAPDFRVPQLATAGIVPAGIPSGGVTINELHLHDIGSDVGPQRAAKFGREVMREVASGFRHDGARNGIHPERP